MRNDKFNLIYSFCRHLFPFLYILRRIYLFDFCWIWWPQPPKVQDSVRARVVAPFIVIPSSPNHSLHHRLDSHPPRALWRTTRTWLGFTNPTCCLCFHLVVPSKKLLRILHQTVEMSPTIHRRSRNLIKSTFPVSPPPPTLLLHFHSVWHLGPNQIMKLLRVNFISTSVSCGRNGWWRWHTEENFFNHPSLAGCPFISPPSTRGHSPTFPRPFLSLLLYSTTRTNKIIIISWDGHNQE